MACESLKGVMTNTQGGCTEEMREKNDDDICFPGDKIPYRPASRNIIVYKNPCLDKRGERKETDGTIFRRIVTGVPLFVMGYARMFPVNMKSFHEEKRASMSATTYML